MPNAKSKIDEHEIYLNFLTKINETRTEKLTKIKIV